MNQTDLEAMGERLGRLERELRLWKRAAMATVVLLLALLAFGPTPRTREARAADSSAKELVARSLTIVDEQGNRRIALDSRPAVMLYDEKGTLRASLAATNDSPVLALFDKRETQRAKLGTGNDGPVLVLFDEKGTLRADLSAAADNAGAGLGLFDEKETPRATLVATKDGSALALRDKEGKPIWRAP